MHSTVDGVAFTAEHTFLDDNGNPIRAKPGYPKAILSKNKQRVTTAIGTPFSPITRRTVLQWKVPPAPPHGACRN